MKQYTLAEAESVLKKFWGYPSFRKGQDKAIESVLQGNDTLILFPTGGGKSLCYQVPAMVLDGLTLVISPLVALMQDQVDQLQKLGIQATFINSTLPGYEIEQRLVNARNGMYKLLYVAPERLASDRWKIEQPRLNINLVAIDEAHCISEWGHDFRPSYRTIREELSDLDDTVTWVALTATATPEVKQDLLHTLQFKNAEVVTGGFKRENLHWWVNKTERKNEMLEKAVKKASSLGSGIVYASTRRDCEKWADIFSKSGIASKAYHAGLKSEKREQVQNEWVSGTISLVVATNAFGMGIDKADCRYVIHYTLPFTLEAYYQEAGRAGRDGEISYPILIYKESDVEYLKSRIIQSYPEYETLKKVYNGICDELNLAVGSLQETPELIDFQAISKRTGLTERECKQSVNVLQRLEILELTEIKEPQIGLHFTVDKRNLEQFISRSKPQKANFVDTLYRQFGSVSFENYFFLSQNHLKRKLAVTLNQLRKALNVFQDHDRILNYKWQSEKTLVHLLESRMSKLQIDHKKAFHYRDVLLKKLDYMRRYAETDQCRDVFLRNYFGETDKTVCGTCDVCLDNNISNEEKVGSEEIRRLKTLFSEGEQSISDLKKKTGWSTGRLKETVKYLVREDVIEFSRDVEGYRLRETWRKESSPSSSN